MWRLKLFSLTHVVSIGFVSPRGKTPPARAAGRPPEKADARRIGPNRSESGRIRPENPGTRETGEKRSRRPPVKRAAGDGQEPPGAPRKKATARAMTNMVAQAKIPATKSSAMTPKPPGVFLSIAPTGPGLAMS